MQLPSTPGRVIVVRPGHLRRAIGVYLPDLLQHAAPVTRDQARALSEAVVRHSDFGPSVVAATFSVCGHVLFTGSGLSGRIGAIVPFPRGADPSFLLTLAGKTDLAAHLRKFLEVLLIVVYDTHFRRPASGAVPVRRSGGLRAQQPEQFPLYLALLRRRSATGNGTGGGRVRPERRGSRPP